MDAVRGRETLIDALTEASSRPGEHRLYRAGKLDGLFPSRSDVCVEAAEAALREGLLARVRLEIKGRTEVEWVELTPNGVEYLHAARSPARALHDLRDTLRANQQAVPLWLAQMQTTLRELESSLTASAESWQARLVAMERRVNETLRRLESAAPLVPPDVQEAHPWSAEALAYLDRRTAAGGGELCPLPELFAAVVAVEPRLSLMEFQEALRKLHRRRSVGLRPAEEPQQMTRPEYAMLVGDAVYYFVTR